MIGQQPSGRGSHRRKRQTMLLLWILIVIACMVDWFDPGGLSCAAGMKLAKGMKYFTYVIYDVCYVGTR